MKSRARAITLAAALLLAASFVFADETPPVETIYAQADTVTVIGERPGSDAMSAPMATAVVPAAAWQAARTSGLDEALANVPGVIAQSRAGSTDCITAQLTGTKKIAFICPKIEHLKLK